MNNTDKNNLRLKIKNVYVLLCLIYILVTILEIVKYFISESSLYGLIYLIMCIIIIFFITTTTINYNKGNKKKRFSKILIAVLLGLFSSFLLPLVIDNSLNYEILNSYIDRNKLTINIIKPIIYLLFLLIAFYDIKMNSKKSKNIKFDVKTLENRLKTPKNE